MPTTTDLAAFLGRSLLRTAAILVAVIVLASTAGVVLLVGTNPPSPRAGGYVFAAFAVAAVGGLLLSVLVLLETAIDLVGFARGEDE